MALVTLQTILQDAFPAYEQTHPLPAYVRRAARASCSAGRRFSAGYIQACPDGHMTRIWYNSCSASVLSAMRLPPDRAVAHLPTCPTPGL